MPLSGGHGCELRQEIHSIAQLMAFDNKPIMNVDGVQKRE